MWFVFGEVVEGYGAVGGEGIGYWDLELGLF